MGRGEKIVRWLACMCVTESALCDCGCAQVYVCVCAGLDVGLVRVSICVFVLLG